MINFKRLTIEGFQCIGHLDLSLDNGFITVLRAPNGFGKSSVFSALVWGLYGKNLKGGNQEVNTWDKYQTKDYQGTRVSISFNKEGHTYQITRCRNYKGEVDGARGNNRLIYLVDAEPVQEKKTKNIQEVINQDLEMSFKLFIHSVMFGQGLTRLIQENNGDQKAIFEEIFDLSYLSKAKDLTKQKISELKTFYIESNTKYQNLKRGIEEDQDNLDSLQEEEAEYGQRYREERHQLRKKLKEVRGELGSLEESCKGNPENMEHEIARLRGEIRISRDKISVAKSNTNISLEDFITKIIGLLEKGDVSSSLTTLRGLKSSFVEIEKNNQRIYALSKTQEAWQDNLMKLNKSLSQRKVLETKYKGYKEQLQSSKKQKPNFSKLRIKYQESLAEKRDRIKALESKVDTLSRETSTYEWVYNDPLGNAGLKSFLFESSITSLNEILESYSEVLGFTIRFVIDKNSAYRNFSTSIFMDGIEVSYDELSGGQKQLINLAMAFAMNSLVSKAKGINIAFLDEVFESLSSDNIDLVVGLIKKVYAGKSLFLITHQESLPISNSKTLTVKRVKGIATYEWR